LRSQNLGVPESPSNVDQYIASFPEDVREVLTRIRATILAAVPACGEKISYGMPMVTVDGRNLVSFAAWKKHIGVYPIPEGDAAFRAEIAPFRDAKATARFPLDEPIPYDLIGRLAGFLAAERGAG
jgi:uncharacterized protein YdhG (YjbR/CyaY superfamily)